MHSVRLRSEHLQTVELEILEYIRSRARILHETERFPIEINENETGKDIDTMEQKGIKMQVYTKSK